MSNIEKGIASLLTNGECDLDTLNWASLRYQHTAAVQASLLEKRSPATVKKMMCAFKRVLRETRKLELMDAQSYAAAVELPPIKSSKKLRGRALSQNEIIALMEVCTLDPTPQGTRDAALIAILRGAGLRRAEVVKLELKPTFRRLLIESEGFWAKTPTVSASNQTIKSAQLIITESWSS